MSTIKVRKREYPVGVGNPNADIFILNSYARDREFDEMKAMPFKEITDWMERWGVTWDDVYYTNAIKEWFPKGYKYKVADMNKDKPILINEIAKVKPKYMLIVGAQAMKMTLDKPLTTNLGVEIEWEGIKCIPTYSPTIVFRDPGKEPFVNQAMSNFGDLLDGVTRSLPRLNIKMITNMAQLKKSFKTLRNADGVSYDIETTGTDRYTDKINLVGYGNDEHQFIIPTINHKYSPLRGKLLVQKKLVRQAIKYLNRMGVMRTAANGKFDNLFLEYHYGLNPFLDFDTVLASHMLNENTANGVKENAILECNALDWDIPLELKTGKAINSQDDWDRLITYLGYDIYYEYMLYSIFKKRIKEQHLNSLFYHLSMPAIRSYEPIERVGTYVNEEQFDIVDKMLHKKLKGIERKLKKYKKGVNWASSQQVAEFIYNDLGLPVTQRTDGGAPSTGESALLELVDKHPAIQLILDHRGVAIQISHFVEGWKSRMKQDRRLHPSFKMLTVTGRTSCKDPNLQQVPRDPTIRKLLGAPDGRVFIEMDLSQAELRIAAIMAHDETMLGIYSSDSADIHTETYKIISGEDELSKDKYEAKEQRKKAKAVNFGLLYGMGWKKLILYAKDNYGVIFTPKEAQNIRERYFEMYSKLLKWHARQRKVVHATGEVRSLIGRVRRLPDIYSSDRGKVAEAERQAINSPVQGFGSDFLLLGMIEVMGNAEYYNRKCVLDKERFDCIGTVHDAALFEVDEAYVLEFIEKAKTIMDNPRALKKVFKFKSPIPIVVDCAVGHSWGGGTELDFDGDWKAQVKEIVEGAA